MREYLLYVKDILAAILSIEEFIAGMDFSAFFADDKTVSAVIRKLEIIGESAKNIPEAVKQKYSQVPWKEMAGMRDRLIHAYFAVSYELVWKAIRDRLPDVKLVIQQIIREASRTEDA